VPGSALWFTNSDAVIASIKLRSRPLKLCSQNARTRSSTSLSTPLLAAVCVPGRYTLNSISRTACTSPNVKA
jgi:hypothetical protein